MVQSTDDNKVKKPVKNDAGNGKDAAGGRNGKAVGDALRDAYDQAVSEGIPDDMLDLLKKLG